MTLVLLAHGGEAVRAPELVASPRVLRIRLESGESSEMWREPRFDGTGWYNYADGLRDLRRFKEAKSLLRRLPPVARRVLGESHELTLKMRRIYAKALCLDTGATLDDVREAVTTLEDTSRIARRVLGGAHPLTKGIENALQNARAILRAREDA